MMAGEPCTCDAMPPGGECVPCEMWRCLVCLKVNNWWDSGTDSDGGLCDECWCRGERLRERFATLKMHSEALSV